MYLWTECKKMCAVHQQKKGTQVNQRGGGKGRRNKKQTHTFQCRYFLNLCFTFNIHLVCECEKMRCDAIDAITLKCKIAIAENEWIYSKIEQMQSCNGFDVYILTDFRWKLNGFTRRVCDQCVSTTRLQPLGCQPIVHLRKTKKNRATECVFISIDTIFHILH